ncbi:hypothetical protein Clacol_006850 [Clathrus columnatus]|uniref:Uncharacterized protein n=1 Tax=Clathrus columnatus TaxID=1419009 RepID=A0AAV5AFU4_9AGAM|nr:hypothetical protein Clacol_006850 [Clathrus columnatus]
MQSGMGGSKSTSLQQFEYVSFPLSESHKSYVTFSDLTSSIITVLFEAGVAIVTAYHVWGLYRLERSSEREDRRLSLGTLCLRQSVFRFAMIFLFGLEQAISLNLSSFRLGGVEADIEFALSAIILRQRHGEVSETSMSTLSMFNAGLPQLSGDSIMDEFGGEEYYPSSYENDLTEL